MATRGIRNKWVLESGRGRGGGRGLRCVMQQAAVLTWIFDAEVPWNDYLLLRAFANVFVGHGRQFYSCRCLLTCASFFPLQASGLLSSADTPAALLVITNLLKHLQKTMSQSSEHSGRAYLVTGAASGMGLATAKLLLARGACVAATDINETELATQYRDTGNERAITIVLDITKKDAVQRTLDASRHRFGRLDGIANFAGTGGHRLGLDNVWETTPEEADFLIDLNVKGLYNILHEGLQEGRLSEPGGSIVHIASMFAEVGFKKDRKSVV